MDHEARAVAVPGVRPDRAKAFYTEQWGSTPTTTSRCRRWLRFIQLTPRSEVLDRTGMGHGC